MFKTLIEAVLRRTWMSNTLKLTIDAVRVADHGLVRVIWKDTRAVVKIVDQATTGPPDTFKRSLAVLAALPPGLGPEVYGTGRTEAGHEAVVLEDLAGETLQSLVNRQALTHVQLVTCVYKALWKLEHHGRAHGNLTMDHILLCPGGDVRMVGFGPTNQEDELTRSAARQDDVLVGGCIIIEGTTSLRLEDYQPQDLIARYLTLMRGGPSEALSGMVAPVYRRKSLPDTLSSLYYWLKRHDSVTLDPITLKAGMVFANPQTKHEWELMLNDEDLAPPKRLKLTRWSPMPPRPSMKEPAPAPPRPSPQGPRPTPAPTKGVIRSTQESMAPPSPSPPMAPPAPMIADAAADLREERRTRRRIGVLFTVLIGVLVGATAFSMLFRPPMPIAPTAQASLLSPPLRDPAAVPPSQDPDTGWVPLPEPMRAPEVAPEPVPAPPQALPKAQPKATVKPPTPPPPEPETRAATPQPKPKTKPRASVPPATPVGPVCAPKPAGHHRFSAPPGTRYKVDGVTKTLGACPAWVRPGSFVVVLLGRVYTTCPLNADSRYEPDWKECRPG